MHFYIHQAGFFKVFSKLFIFIILLNCCNFAAKAAILPLTFIKSNNLGTATSSNIKNNFGYLEHQSNGTLLLQSPATTTTTTATNATAQTLLLFKTILNAIKLAAPFQHNVGAQLDGGEGSTKFNIKIYGEGVEHRFPPFLENIIQRIQSYFSVYKYTDTSQVRPVVAVVETETEAQTNATLLADNAQLNSAVLVEGSGGGDELQSSDTTVADDAEFVEIISIGENDGFIIVGED